MAWMGGEVQLKRGKRKGLQGQTRKLLEMGGYVHYLDCGDSFVYEYICQNLTLILTFIVCQLYLNKTFLKT